MQNITRVIGVCVLVLGALPAFAADKALTSAFCNQLVKHTPSADVAYQAGVDVRGNKVVPADLPSQQQIALPDKIQIPLTINLAKSLNLDTTTAPYNQLGQGTETTLGMLSVEDGKVLYNGNPLGDAEQDRLAVLCMKPK